jgi:hypothetical protein
VVLLRHCTKAYQTSIGTEFISEHLEKEHSILDINKIQGATNQQQSIQMAFTYVASQENLSKRRRLDNKIHAPSQIEPNIL